MTTRRQTSAALRPSERGFTLIEMIVVTLLLLIAMVGLLAVFDASARINKSETDVADAQGSVRYGIYQMTRAIRMAGAGGLYVTQAVLNPYDNVAGVVVAGVDGLNYAVRTGTDMIEVRGVLYSPLVGFNNEPACSPCIGTQPLPVKPLTGTPELGEYLNNDPTIRPQFAAIDAYTAGASNAKPMLVIVQDAKGSLHVCGNPGPPLAVDRYPQEPYNVGTITAPTDLVGTNTFGNVDFGGTLGPRFNIELPSLTPGAPAQAIVRPKRAGILDDVVFFITTDPRPGVDTNGIHPFLAQGIRRGNAFEVTRLADDVEDMQVAYGIDGDGDGAVTRLSGSCPPTTDDPDTNFSTTAGCDEWFPNAVGESAPDAAQFQQQDPFNPTHDTGSIHCPRLHAVMVSLLAKSRDPDPTYRGPAAQGYKIMNTAATPVGPGNYRRRIQTLKINVRNFAFQG
jgi:prepilin-type N-terminal cleavage/methylation domain-containing protein